MDRALTWTQIQQQIQAALEINQLRLVREQIPVIATRWKKRGLPVAEIRTAVNHWHELVMQQVIHLTMQQVEKEEGLLPKVPFCFALLGSGGRQEMTLHPDQDHALIYANDEQDHVQSKKRSEEEARYYFQKLAEKVTLGLQAVGYPPCQGYVMAINPRWNLSQSAWERQMDAYLEYPSWDHTRYLMMLSDLRAIYGDRTLADWLLAKLDERVRPFAFLHWQVADHLREKSLSLRFRKSLRTEEWGERAGQVEIKEGGYLPLIGLVRLHAVVCGITATSTKERLAHLRAKQVWSSEEATQVERALDVLCSHRLFGNYVQPELLSTSEVQALQQALQTVRHLQKVTAKKFRKPK